MHHADQGRERKHDKEAGVRAKVDNKETNKKYKSTW